MTEILNLNNILVLVALGVAVFTDIKFKKVDNRFVVGLFLIGLIVQLILHGTSSLWLIGASLATAIVLGLPLYILRVFGGGDFKLLLAISVLLDWRAVVAITVTSFFWGAILGFFQVAMQGDLKSIFHNMLSLFLRNKTPIQKLHAMPFTVAIFFGFLSHLTLSQVGLGFI